MDHENNTMNNGSSSDESLKTATGVNNQQNKLAEELEDELKAFEAEQKVSEI